MTGSSKVTMLFTVYIQSIPNGWEVKKLVKGSVPTLLITVIRTEVTENSLGNGWHVLYNKPKWNMVCTTETIQ